MTSRMAPSMSTMATSCTNLSPTPPWHAHRDRRCHLQHYDLDDLQVNNVLSCHQWLCNRVTIWSTNWRKYSLESITNVTIYFLVLD
jgi:hypothetical protein